MHSFSSFLSLLLCLFPVSLFPYSQAGVDHMTSHLRQTASERDRHIRDLQRLATALRGVRRGEVQTVRAEEDDDRVEVDEMNETLSSELLQSSGPSSPSWSPVGSPVISGSGGGMKQAVEPQTTAKLLTPRMVAQAIEDSKTEIEVTLREMHLSILEKVLAYDPSAAMQIRGATTASGEDEEEGGNGGSGSGGGGSGGRSFFGSSSSSGAAASGGSPRAKKKPARPVSPRTKRQPPPASRPRSPRTTRAPPESGGGGSGGSSSMSGSPRAEKRGGPQLRPVSPRASAGRKKAPGGQ